MNECSTAVLRQESSLYFLHFKKRYFRNNPINRLITEKLIIDGLSDEANH